MIKPSDRFFFDDGDSLEVLCRKLLEKIRDDVWADVPNKIQVFFKTTDEELKENAKIFRENYEILLPDLLIKNMETKVRPIKNGYEFVVKIPFTKTKTITNSVFLTTNLMNIRKVRGLFFDPEFQDDLAGISAPKYIQFKFTLDDNDEEKFQELFDSRRREVEIILNDAKETTELYNSKIEEMFLKEFARRKEKIEKGTDFTRTLKVSKDDKENQKIIEQERLAALSKPKRRIRFPNIKKIFPNEQVPESMIIAFVVLFIVLVLGGLVWLG